VEEAVAVGDVDERCSRVEVVAGDGGEGGPVVCGEDDGDLVVRLQAPPYILHSGGETFSIRISLGL
jgi:hypothetical protein